MAVSFAADIRPLFTEIDVDHMQGLGVLLDDYEYMRDPDHAQRVIDAVNSGSMPPSDSGEPSWSVEQVQLFREWMSAGYPA